MGKNSRRNRRRRERLMDASPDTSPTPSTELDFSKVGIPFPPDHIFKYRKPRVNAAQGIWGTGSVSYIPYRAEYREGEGNFVFYRGLGEQPPPKYPSECVAPVDAIYAINPPKRRLINDIRLLSSKEARFLLGTLALMGKKRRARLLNKYLEMFNNEADITLTPFYLGDGYYCKPVKEIRKFIQNFLMAIGVKEFIAEKTGEVIGSMFEYDNAYRFRFQDLASETTKEKLYEDFPRELERLIQIYETRDIHTGQVFGGGTTGVEVKLKSLHLIIKLAWHIPSLRQAIKKGVEAINIENCGLNPETIYHTLLYGDYNVAGKRFQCEPCKEASFKRTDGILTICPNCERAWAYQQIHGPDQSKWPPRIMIRNTV